MIRSDKEAPFLQNYRRGPSMRALSGNREGFTLIELIVVIIILGILAAIAVPRLFTMQQDARDSVAKGVLGALRGANVALFTRYLVGGTNTPYGMQSIAAEAQVQGVRGSGVGPATLTVDIDGSIYTFSLTAPVMPTTMGIVYVQTATW